MADILAGTVLSDLGYTRNGEWSSRLYKQNIEAFINKTITTNYRYFMVYHTYDTWSGGTRGYVRPSIKEELLANGQEFYCTYLGSKHRNKVLYFKNVAQNAPEYLYVIIGLTEDEYRKYANNEQFAMQFVNEWQ